MKLRRWISVALYAALSAILLAIVVVVVVGLRDHTFKAVDLWGGAIPVFVAIITVILGPLQSGRKRRVPVETTVDELVPVLAKEVNAEWREERFYRGLFDGRRADLRWTAAPGSDPRSPLAEALPENGTLDRLTAGFGHHARGGALTRLVVTGEAGAGKTAACVLLTLELDERGPVVPVLFQLASWDPRTSLHEWMAGELVGNYPFLVDHENGRQIAARMVRGHILPILDGLDEVRDCGAALRRIEDELAGRSFVLTCRAEEFAAANAGHPLHQAFIVHLQPMRADEVRDYLLGYEPGDGRGRLEPLAAALDDQPGGPAATALRTPFMMSLAVAPGEPVPAELLAEAGPGAADRIERHLLGALVGKTYAHPPPGQEGDHGGVTPEAARRYLAFLARHVDPVTGRLAWWRLHLAVPRAVFLVVAVVVAGTVCSGLAAGYFSVFERPWLGFLIGLVAGVAGSFIVELIPQEDPRRATPRLRPVRAVSEHALLRTLGFGLTGGAACAVIVLVLYESPRYVVIGAALSGLTFAMARYFSEPSDPMTAVTPGSLLRNDRAAVLFGWLAGGVPGALTGAYLGASLRDGHRVPELDGLAIITLPPALLALLGAIAGFGLSAAGLGLMVHGSSSWGRFITTRTWLAMRGHTPRRLMTFLADSRKLGVLRQVNGYYEFRHRLLLHYLAQPGTLPAASPDAGSPGAGPPEAGSPTPSTTVPESTQ